MTTDAHVVCPYCGEAVIITVDLTDNALQEYVEDCEVCCRPWNVHVSLERDGTTVVEVAAADDLG